MSTRPPRTKTIAAVCARHWGQRLTVLLRRRSSPKSSNLARAASTDSADRSAVIVSIGVFFGGGATARERRLFGAFTASGMGDGLVHESRADRVEESTSRSDLLTARAEV